MEPTGQSETQHTATESAKANERAAACCCASATEAQWLVRATATAVRRLVCVQCPCLCLLTSGRNSFHAHQLSQMLCLQLSRAHFVSPKVSIQSNRVVLMVFLPGQRTLLLDFTILVLHVRVGILG